MRITKPLLLGVLTLGLFARQASSQAIPIEPGQDPESAPSGLIGGVGLYLVQPYLASNLAYTAMRDTGRRGQPNFSRVDDRTEIDNCLEVTPQAWLGYIDECGWGGRGRFWYFRQETDQTVRGKEPNFDTGTGQIVYFAAAPLGFQVQAFPNQELNVTSKLELQVYDLEALRQFQTCGCNFILAAGVRFARFDQTYNAYLRTEGRTIDSVLSGHTFNGVGPTLAADLRCPLGGCGLSIIGSARGAMLFGTANQHAALQSQNSSGTDQRTRSMLVGELDLGLEYGVAVGQSWLFGQVALVGQNWSGAGSASRATPEVVPGGGLDARGSFTQDSDIGFLGVAFRLGVNY